MDVTALAISVLSLMVAGVGTVLANRRSKEAIEESRKAAASAMWLGVQEAVQRMIGFDPASEPVGDRLANLRIAMISLVDHLPGWAGLDEWLEAERALGATLGRQVMAHAQPRDSIDRRFEILEPYQRWAQVLGSNLRRFRVTGHDASALVVLREYADSQTRQVCQAQGWPVPTKLAPGVRTLGE